MRARIAQLEIDRCSQVRLTSICRAVGTTTDIETSFCAETVHESVDDPRRSPPCPGMSSLRPTAPRRRIARDAARVLHPRDPPVYWDEPGYDPSIVRRAPAFVLALNRRSSD